MEPHLTERPARPYVLVVGVKFDPVGEMTIQQAVLLADGHRDAWLHLCHIVEEPLPAPGALSPRLTALLDDRAEMLQVFALDKVSASAHRLKERMRLHVGMGDTAAALVRFACDTHADAIVVGAHPATKETGVIHGAVAMRLSEISPCSVFVVRPSSYQGMPMSAVAERDPFATSGDDEPPPSSQFRRHVRLRWIGNMATMQEHTLGR